MLGLEGYALKCRNLSCGKDFALCRADYRGQYYCSKECRMIQQRINKSARDKKYRNSKLGKLSQKKRQKKYRACKKLKIQQNFEVKNSVTVATSNLFEPIVGSHDASAKLMGHRPLYCIVCKSEIHHLYQRSSSHEKKKNIPP